MYIRMPDFSDRLLDGNFNNSLRFVTTTIFLLALALLLPDRLFSPFNQANAAAAARLLDHLGYAPILKGNLIQLDGFRASVITECSVLYPALLFGSFLSTFPASKRYKALGLVLGLPVLFSLNTMRLAAVVVAGASHPRLFEVLHVYLGQITMVLAVCLLALLWLKWADSGSNSFNNLPFLVRLGFWSAVLFLPWLLLNRPYVAASDRPIVWIFSLFGYPLFLPVNQPLYYQTFNVVTFSALLLASRPTWKLGAEAWIKGMLALWLGHEAFRVCNVLLTAYAIDAAFRVSLLIHLIGQYALPVALWLILVRPPWSSNVAPNSQSH